MLSQDRQNADLDRTVLGKKFWSSLVEENFLILIFYCLAVHLLGTYTVN